MPHNLENMPTPQPVGEKKKKSVADVQGHYDIDGVSLTPSGVVMAGQNPIYKKPKSFSQWLRHLFKHEPH